MSAFTMVCPACRETYMAGMVGRTLWPLHECPLRQLAEQMAVALELQGERGVLLAQNKPALAAYRERFPLTADVDLWTWRKGVLGGFDEKTTPPSREGRE